MSGDTTREAPKRVRGEVIEGVLRGRLGTKHHVLQALDALDALRESLSAVERERDEANERAREALDFVRDALFALAHSKRDATVEARLQKAEAALAAAAGADTDTPEQTMADALAARGMMADPDTPEVPK